jgi:hypothetical protein
MQPGVKGPDGIDIKDYGGNGDCAFRAVAAATLMITGHTDQYIEENLDKKVTTLRIKAAQHMRKTESVWASSWCPDSEATEAIEDGPIPKNLKDYLASLERPRRWVDAWTLAALAQVVNSDIMVVKFVDGAWKKQGVFKARAKPTSTVLPLFLKAGHYTTGKISKQWAVPQSWRDMQEEAVDLSSMVVRGAGRSVASTTSTLRVPTSTATSVRVPSTAAQSLRVPTHFGSAATRVSPPASASSRPASASRPSRKRPLEECQRQRTCTSTPTGSSTSSRCIARLPVAGAGADAEGPRAQRRRIAMSEKTFTWTCIRCGWRAMSSTAKGCNNAASDHRRQWHRDLGADLANMVRKYDDIIAPIAGLAKDLACWTCSSCGKSLPHMEMSQRLKSARAHLSACAPGVTMYQNALRVGSEALTRQKAKMKSIQKAGNKIKSARIDAKWDKKSKKYGHKLAAPIENILKGRPLRICRLCARAMPGTTKKLEKCKGAAARKYNLDQKIKLLRVIADKPTQVEEVMNAMALKKGERQRLEEQVRKATSPEYLARRAQVNAMRKERRATSSS